MQTAWLEISNFDEKSKLFKKGASVFEKIDNFWNSGLLKAVFRYSYEISITYGYQIIGWVTDKN